MDSVKDSQRCWERFPGKKKSRYSECSKGAVIPFHVFCEGKRLLRDVKKDIFEKCRDLVEPKRITQCRNEGYEEILKQVGSLERWVDREREKFDPNNYA